MPAPTLLPDWDTNGTHTTPILAGHTTDGFINNEVPGSAELNQWMMLVGQWVRWTSVGRVRNILAAAFQAETGTPAYGRYWGGGGTTTAPWVVEADLGLFVGQKLSEVVFYYQNAAGFALTCSILKHAFGTSTGGDTVLATFTDSTAGGDTSHTFSGLTETIADGFGYRLQFSSNYGLDIFMGCRVTADV